MKGRQWACTAPSCQRQRHAENQRRWLARNPGAFRGRYENTKIWLLDHPGYLKEWRSYARDIQDSVIDDSPYLSLGYGDLKSLIYKTPYLAAARSVFWPP